MDEGGPRFGARGIALLLIGVIVGALAIAPGIGAAAQFLTKGKGNKTFLGNTTVLTQAGTTSSSAETVVTILCPSGQQATGGGADTPTQYDETSNDQALIILESGPVGTAQSTGWRVEVIENSGQSISFTAYAVCSK